MSLVNTNKLKTQQQVEKFSWEIRGMTWRHWPHAGTVGRRNERDAPQHYPRLNKKLRRWLFQCEGRSARDAFLRIQPSKRWRCTCCCNISAFRRKDRRRHESCRSSSVEWINAWSNSATRDPMPFDEYRSELHPRSEEWKKTDVGGVDGGIENHYLENVISSLIEFALDFWLEQVTLVEKDDVDIARPWDDGSIANSPEQSAVDNAVR